MSDSLSLLKGLKENLPSSNITPGAMYVCTDTGEIFLASTYSTAENETGITVIVNDYTEETNDDGITVIAQNSLGLIANKGVNGIIDNGTGNVLTSLTYNPETQKITCIRDSVLSAHGGNLTGHIYLTGAQVDNSINNTTQIVFGTPANNYVALSSTNNALVINPNINETTNQIILSLDKSSLFPNGITGNLTGNADTATKFATPQTITLTGDITGTVTSQAGWTIATTLKESGATAGSYGPSTSITGDNNTTMLIPYFTVDTYGRIINVENKTYTAKNTDTHYTTKLFATDLNGTAHAATTNGNTYLRLFDDSTARQSIKITGSGATTVSSDANGVITINSPDTQNLGTITEIQANGTSIATNGIANIPAASTSSYGVTQLSNEINNTSTTLAATTSAVKTVYDLANSKAPGYTYGTDDLSAGISELATGTLYFVYE